MPEAVKKKREFTIERPRRRDIPTTKPVAVPAAHGMSPPEPSTLDVVTAIAALRRELSTLRDEWRSPTPEQLSVAAEPVKLADDDVRMDLSKMMESIGRAKVEIAAIKHPMAQGDRLGKASRQLDAIVAATESATNDILRACEQIESAVAEYAESRTEDGEMASLAEDIGGQIVKIMEAYSFQDLTGRRVTKVFRTVEFIEERIQAMI